MRCSFLGSFRNPHNGDEGKDKSELQSARLQTVGGHAQNFLVQDGFLIKNTNRTEGRFYEQITSHKLGLSDFVPKCTSIQYSTEALRLDKDKQGYAKVTIEDLRRGFKEPLIYDIKLGIKTVSSKEQKVSGSSKSEILRKDFSLHLVDIITSSFKRGYRFVGSSTSQDSRFHLGTHPDEMINHMVAHISSKDLSMVLAKLDTMRSYLNSKEGRSFEFIGASVLIIAESDPFTIESGQAAEPLVKLIDFAHSNMIGPKGLELDNGVLHTQHRKKVYQKGFRHGIAQLADDMRACAR